MGKTNTKTPNPDKLPIGKFLAWRASAWSLAANFIIMSFLTIYCTDTLKMPAALVGTLLLASKVLDAVGELFAGYLVDNTKTKWGKGRPWDLCYIGLWVCTILLYSTPSGASLAVKSVWVFVMYLFVQSVFQTMIAAAGMPYTMRAFANKNVIIKVQSYGGIIGMVLSIVVSVLFPMMMARLATSPQGWTTLVTIFAAPLLIFGLMRFFFVKEIYNVEEEKEERIKLSDTIKVMKENKYIWFVCGITLTMQAIQGMGAATYYFKYIGGGIEKMSQLQIISIALLFLMFVFPKFIKRYSVSGLIAVGCIFSIIGSIIVFFAKDSMPMLIAGGIFTGIGMLAPPYLIPVMILDCAKYNEWKGNKPMEATMSAVNNFGTNVGSGIGSAIVGFLLAAAGYVGGAATQTPEALFTIRCMYSLVPAILYVLMFIFAKMFTIEKQSAQMDKDIAMRKADVAASV
jgi:Na+/melibiose symporter-like transporter